MEERRLDNRREIDDIRNTLMTLESNKVSFKLFLATVSGFGLLLVLILTSTIALHVAFSDFKIDVVDRITSIDKNVTQKVAEIKIEIEKKRRVSRWDSYGKIR